MSRARDLANGGHILDDAVTLAKMASGIDGQVITYDASGNPSAVGPGSDGEVLTSTGAGSPPAFEPGATTSYSFVSYTQVPSPDNQTFTIDNVFTNSFRSYKVIISGIIGASNMDTSVVNLRFLDDSGSQISGSNYYYILAAKDSSNTDRTIYGQGTSNLNLSQNFGADSSKKEGLTGDLLFSGTRTDSIYTRVEGVFTHEIASNDLVTTTISGVYRGTSGGDTKSRGFELIGGGGSNHWTQNSDGGVYVYGINHA